MEFWEREMAPLKARLEPLAAAQRLALAVDAITWTLETLPNPIENEPASDWITQVLPFCRQAVDAGAVRAVLPQDLDDAYEEVDGQAEEPGASHFLSAVLACTEGEDGLAADDLYTVLSFCYEGSLAREDVPVWTLEAEQANPRCQQVIAFQKELIYRADA